MHHPTDRIAHTTAFVTLVVEHCILDDIIITGCNDSKERKDFFLFNDTLNTQDSERGNPLPPHGLLFLISRKHALSHRQDDTYHSLCYISRGALAGMRNSSMGPP